MRKIVIAQQFCGPPNSGNGGYVCGVLAKDLDGPATSVLRARVPLDVDLNLDHAEGAVMITDADGGLIGRGGPGDAATLPVPPAPLGLAAAQAAGERYPGHKDRMHPICFTCGPERAEGDGLRVFPGQVEGAPEGQVACVWTPDAAFADPEGLMPTEVVWAALDCPGYFAWVVKEGRHGALLGTMTGEVLRRPRAGEPTIVLAWPLVREGRKETAGVALFSADGELMARAHQIWITTAPAFPAKAETAAA
ncbi:hypothetical protein [Phenylobacterium sp.]|uniref:hypothetical protein n=1 Tax=Phenylobacterium sp. TaxID=1871053 RepID=UPI0012133662|nr:hypothetical protein [Phenylobacterium sp.]THD57601.1 MAG: hypothetical protein E8A49_22450 [Phenylobacterium sp.]